MTFWGLGVDLGTTFCTGAVLREDRIDLLEIAGELRTPSTVMWREGTLLAGRHADRLRASDPGAVERNPKRKVGAAPMILAGTPVTATMALSAQLRLFVEEGTRRAGGQPPGTLVLTHPAAWNPAQLQVLHEVAATVAPGATTVLVPEPVAAAVQYAADNALPTGARIAVYDLGGGTFDTAVLQVSPTGFEVIGHPGGDDDIGGEVFDWLVYDHLLDQLHQRAPETAERLTTGEDLTSQRDRDEVLRAARNVKEALSEYPDASEYLRCANTDVHLTRTQYEDLIHADLERSLTTLDHTLATAGADPTDLAGIFLTGAASRTPLVHHLLHTRYGPTIRTWGDPKLAVAHGAARLTHPTRTLTTEDTPGSPHHLSTGATNIGPSTLADSSPATTTRPSATESPSSEAGPSAATGSSPSASSPSEAGPSATTTAGDLGEDSGLRLASAGDDGAVHVWDPVTGQHRYALQGHGRRVNAVAFSPDGEILASASENRTVCLWSAREGRCVRVLVGHGQAVHAVAFCPQDPHLLVSAGQDTTLWLWNAPSGQCLRVLTGHTRPVRAVVFSADGSVLVSGAADHTVRIWDARTGQCLGPLLGHTHPVTDVVFAPAGGPLASAGQDRTVRLWDLTTGTCTSVLAGYPAAVHAVAFSPTGDRLAVACADGTIHLSDPGSGAYLGVLGGHLRAARGLAFSADGALLASASEDLTARVWDTHTGQCRWTLTGHAGAVRSVALTTLPDPAR